MQIAKYLLKNDPNANITNLEDAIVASNDPEYIYKFTEYLATTIPNADIERLVKKLIILRKAEVVIIYILSGNMIRLLEVKKLQCATVFRYVGKARSN